MAAEYDANATQEPIQFTTEMQSVMIAGAFDVCERRSWWLHAIGFEPNHVHLLISWKDFVEWIEVRDKLKNLLSLFLGRLTGEQGRKWFVEGGSRKRVTNRRHFDYLIDVYVPGHSRQKWFEGDALPAIHDQILNPPR